MVQHAGLMGAQQGLRLLVAHMPPVAREVDPRVTAQDGFHFGLGHLQAIVRQILCLVKSNYSLDTSGPFAPGFGVAFDWAMLPFQLVYHDQYDLNLGDHVFPSQKFKWLRDRLLQIHFAEPADFTVPEPATDEDVLLVHDSQWVAKLRNGTLSYQDLARLEIPYSRQMVEAFWLAAGGT